MLEREGVSKSVSVGVSLNKPSNEGDQPISASEISAEEQDLLDRDAKKVNNDVIMEGTDTSGERKGITQEARDEEFKANRDSGAQMGPKNGPQTPFNLKQRSPISYKSKLMGREEQTVSKELEEAMKEWLQEEEEIAPLLTDEQKKLIGTLPSLPMTDDRLKELCMPWKDAVIVTLLGKQANLDKMKDRIAWLIKNNQFELVDLPNNYYVFRSENKDLSRKLLFDGPWMIQGHYLAVQRWSPNFNPYCNKFRKVAVWVRIPTLPMHVYSEECMLEIGNIIGKALKVDINTLAQCNNKSIAVERGKYARVSMEVDLNQPLKSRFVIRRKIYTVEYEGLDLICFTCGKYGHKQESCTLPTGEGNQAGGI